MRRALSLVFILLGASILAISIYNVQVGMVKDIYSENTPRYKLDIPAFLAFNEECSDESVSAGFAKGNPVDCARSVGVWETPDFLGIGIGIVFMLLSRKFKSGVKRTSASGSAERRLKRKRRNARIKFGLGLGLLSFGFADLNGLTTPNGSLDWSAIIGYPVPAISMDISLIIYGSFFMYKSMRFLSRTSDAADMFSQARRKNSGANDSFFESGSRSKFKGGLESLGKSNATVSDLYGQLGLTEYEDDFERNLYDDYGAGGMVPGRTCHLCNGQGCARCNQTGMLD